MNDERRIKIMKRLEFGFAKKGHIDGPHFDMLYNELSSGVNTAKANKAKSVIVDGVLYSSINRAMNKTGHGWKYITDRNKA